MSSIRALAALCMLASLAPARADDEAQRTARAKEIYKLALADFNAGRFEDAMEKFAAGYALRPQPLFLYNAAQSARRAGKKDRAVELFRQFLSVDPNAPERAEALKYIAELAPAEPPARPAEPTPPEPAPPPRSAFSEPPPSVAPAPTPRSAPEPAEPPAPPAVTAPPVSRSRADTVRLATGGALAGLGGAALVSGAVLVGLGAPSLTDAGSSYDRFDAAHRAEPLVIGGAVALSVGVVLITAAAIRFGVKASPSPSLRSGR